MKVRGLRVGIHAVQILANAGDVPYRVSDEVVLSVDGIPREPSTSATSFHPEAPTKPQKTCETDCRYGEIIGARTAEVAEHLIAQFGAVVESQIKR